MRATSDLYKRLLANPGHVKEQRVVINGEIYDESRIVSAESYGGAFERDSLCIGSAVSRQADVNVCMPGDVPAGAEVRLSCRLTLGDESSEWVPKGTFYVDTPETDSETGVLSLHCFDAILKAEIPWEPDQDLVFPMSMPEAMRVTAAIVGVEIDPRTELNEAYTIDYPATDTTIRQIWRWIAAAHGGNFIMAPDGKLRLVPLEKLEKQAVEVLGTEDGEALDFGGFFLALRADAAADASGRTLHETGQDLTSAHNNGLLRPVSRVTLLRDDENMVTAGDDTGLELSADCPFATQTMVDTILDRLAGHQYQMFDATAVNIDPAAELGDLVEADGIRSVLAQIDDDGTGYPDIAAPGEAEREEEFPSAGPYTQEINRKLAQTRSAIEKSAEELRLYVQNDVTNALAEVDISLDAISQRITDGEARTSEIETKVDGIRLETATEAGADGQVYARITIKIGPNAYSGYIKMEGNVDVSGQLSADALYAALGDIADLTVDRLSTSRRIVKYLARDTSDDNFVRVHDQYVEFVSGETDGSEEQAVNPSGMPIYWEADPNGADLGADGYPYRDGERIFTTTAQTDWPVMVYSYEELVKRSIGFEDIDGTYTPVDTFGAGNPQGRHKSTLVKRRKGLELMHLSDNGDIGFVAGDDGYLDLYGLRKTTALDFSGWDDGTFTETVEGIAEPYSYKVEFDSQGRPVKITDDDGHEMAVTW